MRLDDGAVMRADDLMTMHGQTRMGRQADEGITTETLATLHRLE